MEQQVDLTALEARDIDPETFRRVWERVMPDQTNSPIALGPAPAPAQNRKPAPDPGRRPAAPVPQRPALPNQPAPTLQRPAMPNQPAPTPQRPAMPAQPDPGPRPPVMPTQPGPIPRQTEGEDVVLRRLMDLGQEGAAGGQLMARRTGSQPKALTGLVSDYRKALRQLSAAYFLATGRRYQPRGNTPTRSSSLDQALREQFQWEQRWIRACMEGADRVEDPTVRELCRELAREGNLHSRAIRGLLERG